MVNGSRKPEEWHNEMGWHNRNANQTKPKRGREVKSGPRKPRVENLQGSTLITSPKQKHEVKGE